MLTLEMLLHLTLHLEQAQNIDPLVSSLVLIILERPVIFRAALLYDETFDSFK
jgi:hypothetical protein